MITEYSIYDVRYCGCDIPVTARTRKTIYTQVGHLKKFRPIREARGQDMLWIRAQEYFMSKNVELPFHQFQFKNIYTEADIDRAWEAYHQSRKSTKP
jgi:hypothetical protein